MSMFGSFSNLPGQFTSYVSQRRNIWLGNENSAQYCTFLPITIDGQNSSNTYQNVGLVNTNITANNVSYLMFAGQFMGRETTGSLWRNSVIGLTTSAALSSASSFQTDAYTTTEIARLLAASAGGTITLNLTGGTTAGGTAVATVVTVTTASGTTVTVSGTIGAAKVSGSLIQPNDGSQTIVSVLGDDTGLYVQNPFTLTRINNVSGRMCSGGGTLNTGQLVWYGSMDSGVQTYVKKALVVYPGLMASATFQDDITG
jgi:hypothetical protein